MENQENQRQGSKQKKGTLYTVICYIKILWSHSRRIKKINDTLKGSDDRVQNHRNNQGWAWQSTEAKIKTLFDWNKNDVININ